MDGSLPRGNVIAAERRRIILKLAEERETVNAAQLAKMLHVGISTVRRGITTDNRATARQETTILKHGSRFVALCDSSKTGRFAYAQVAPVDAIDVFITDSGADPEFVKQLRDQGVEVAVAAPES